MSESKVIFLPSAKVILLQYVHRWPECKDIFVNIKFDYCKCIRTYEKFHLRSDFWQSKYILQLNKYQTDLYLLELSHQMTNVCLLISENLPRFEKICDTGTQNCFCFDFQMCRTILCSQHARTVKNGEKIRNQQTNIRHLMA